MKQLKAKLYELEIQKQNAEKQALRRDQVRYRLGQPDPFLCAG